MVLVPVGGKLGQQVRWTLHLPLCLISRIQSYQERDLLQSIMKWCEPFAELTEW
jgi:hypothetical protein